MKMLSVIIFTIMCVVGFAPGLFAWTDDVEGVLMPSPRSEDNMSDPEAILENIEPSSDASSETDSSRIEWE